MTLMELYVKIGELLLTHDGEKKVDLDVITTATIDKIKIKESGNELHISAHGPYTDNF